MNYSDNSLIEFTNRNADKLANQEIQSKMEKDMYQMIDHLNRPQLEVKVKFEAEPMAFFRWWVVAMISTAVWTVFIFELLNILKMKGVI